jgi:hypothetical protein
MSNPGNPLRLESIKPQDPSPTPWDFSTWGFYCDTCGKFFDLVAAGKVEGDENGHIYRHSCGSVARYIGYDRNASSEPAPFECASGYIHEAHANGQLRRLCAKLLNIIDAAIPNKDQNRAVKAITRKALDDAHLSLMKLAYPSTKESGQEACPPPPGEYWITPEC